MVGIDRPAVNVRTNGIAPRFLPLDQRVVARLANCLAVAEVEEERGITLVRSLVVDHRGAGMVTVARDQQAVAALARVEITNQCLLPDTMRTAPALVAVETAVLLSIE